MGTTKKKIAVLSASFCVSATMILSTVLAQVSAAFPDVSVTGVQLIMTISQFASFLFTLATGVLATRYQKKYVLVGGVACMLGGLIPAAVSSSIAFMYLAGFFTGIGQGVLIVGVAAAISEFFEGEERSKMFGYNSVVSNGGSVLFMLLAGWLANFGWRRAFLAFALAIPSLALVMLWTPKSMTVKAGTETDSTRAGAKAPLPKEAVIIALFSFLFLVAYYTFSLNASLYIAEMNLGDAQMAAVALSVLTGSGAVSGLFFHHAYKAFKFKILALGFLLAGSAFMIIVFVPNYAAVLATAVIAAFGWNFVVTGTNNMIAEIVPTEQVSFAQGLNGAMYCLGCASSPLIMNAISGMMPVQKPATVFAVSAAALFLFMAAAFVWSLRIKSRAASME